MKIEIEVDWDEYDWGCFHDCVYEAADTPMTQKELEILFNELPIQIKATAIAWGLSDTVFRDEVFTYLKKEIATNV